MISQNPGPIRHPALNWAAGILRQEELRRSDVTIAILGPPGSGKSELLRGLLTTTATLAPDEERRSSNIDLYDLDIGSEATMFGDLAMRLEQALRDAHLPVVTSSEVVDLKHRFDDLILNAVRGSDGRLLLAFDHFEALPRRLAIALSQRLRSLREEFDDLSDLGLIVAGTISLSDLTATSRQVAGTGPSEKSAFSTARVLQLPRQDETSTRQSITEALRDSGVSDPTDQVVELLTQETWGEPCFLAAILQRISDEATELDHKLLKESISAIDSFEIPHLRHAILHLLFNPDLSEIVRNVLAGKRVPRRGRSVDIDEFHLTGVVVLAQNTLSPTYSIRNGMVARLAKQFLLGSELGTGESRLMEELAQVKRAQQAIASSRSLSECMSLLQQTWQTLMSNETPSLFMSVSSLDLTNQTLLPFADESEVPYCVERAVAAIHQEKRTVVEIDENWITVAVPLHGTQSFVCSLTATVPKGQAAVTEYGSRHWKAFVRNSEPALVRLALADVIKRGWSTRSSESSSIPETLGKSTAQLYFNIKSQEALIFRPGEVQQIKGMFDEQWAERVQERDRELVRAGMEKRSFELSVERAGAEVTVVMRNLSEVIRALLDDAESYNWVIVSPIEGLRLPLELLHKDGDTTPLLLKTGVSRRVQGFTVPAALRRPFPALLQRLIESDQPIRLLLVGADGSGHLKVELEMSRVRRRFESGAAGLRLKCEVIEIKPEEASSDRVRAELAYGLVHVFHFCGHGYQEGGETGIVLNANGLDERVSSGQLKSWMIEKGLWLAYFSACQTASLSSDSALLSTGLVEDLLAAGIPNVVGFRWAVSSRSAMVLAEEFYRVLFESPRGSDPANAMLHARRSAKGLPGVSDAWASSVLVTQCPR